MDWTNTANVLQAIYWTSLFFMFAHGYVAGNRMV